MAVLIDIYFFATGASNSFQLNDLLFNNRKILPHLTLEIFSKLNEEQRTVRLELVYIQMNVCHLPMCMRASKVCTNNNF